MSQFISFEQAKEMIDRYKSQMNDVIAVRYKSDQVLALSETFDRASVEAILKQPGCAKLRIYYGMDEGEAIHAILVGANENDEDILPSTASVKTEGVEATDEENGGVIVENAYRCPTNCPPASRLNS